MASNERPINSEATSPIAGTQLSLNLRPDMDPTCLKSVLPRLNRGQFRIGLGGVAGLERQALQGTLAEQVGPVHEHTGRDAACAPVVDTLRAALPAEAKGISKPGVAAVQVDDRGGAHAHISTPCVSKVNAALADIMFKAQTIADMHESAKRLLDGAREATVQASDRVHDFADISRRLSVSSATMTNWKKRGVSKEGALAAERAFNINAHWVLTGEGNPLNNRQVLDRAVSLAPAIMGSQLVTWESLMREMPATFRVAAPDDAMSPRVRAGRVVEFEAASSAAFGDGVLVRASDGRLYFRLYAEAKRGGWEARPLNDVYRTLTPEADGIVIVAVVTSVPQRWSEA